MKRVLLAITLAVFIGAGSAGCAYVAEKLQPGTERVQQLIDTYCAAATQTERDAIRAEINKDRVNKITVVCEGDA